MEKQEFEPITYSNEWFKDKRLYLIAGFLGLLAIGSVLIGIYLASFYGDWWVMFFFILFAAVFGFFAYIFYPTKQKDIYRYKLTNEGLHQQWLHKPTSQETKQFVPFDEIDQVLIGIYAERVRIPDSKNYFRYHAMLIIIHNDDYFIEKFLSADDLQEWIKRLKGNVANLQYTNYDLYEAYHAQYYTKIDFSQIEGNKHDCVSHLVGKETVKNILFSWQPEEIEEVIHAQKKITKIPNVRRAEKRTIWIVFFYNFLFAAFFLGGTPLDEDNIIELTDTILVGQLVVNILIPCILVFWRKFTKWYLPTLLTGASFIGLSLGVCVPLLFSDLPFIYESILGLCLFHFVLWTCAMIGIKLFLFVADYMYKQNL